MQSHTLHKYMNNHTLLRLFYIQEHSSKNIWGNYATENPNLELYLYLSILHIFHNYVTTCVVAKKQ